MVKISNGKDDDDDDASSYLRPKIFGFSSLSKEHENQKNKIQSGFYGYGAKFILEYNKELAKFNEITLNGYKLINSRFQTLCSSCTKISESIQQNLKTTICNETYTNIVDETIPSEEAQSKNNLKSKKVKKRTIDEQKADTAITETTCDVLNQTNKIKKKKKLKAKRISKSQSSDKLDTTAELVAKNLLEQSIKSEKLSLLVTNNTYLTDTVKKNNPNKKVRLTQENSAGSLLNKKPKKVKSKKSKKKSSLISKKSSINSVTLTKTTTSLFAECYTTTKFEFNQIDTKTPVKMQTKQLNLIMESNSKTIKAEKRIPSVHASGKVKQMVEMVEARMKTSMQNTPNTAIKQTNSKLPQYSKSIQTKKTYLENVSTLAAAAKKLRSSIDDRKKRISNTKKETKRQSSKRINAFLTDISLANTVKHTQPVVMNQVSTVKKKLNYQQTKQEIKSEPIEHEEPTVNHHHHHQQNQETKPKRTGLADLIVSNSSVQQQYRLKQTSSINSDFNRFLDRNTPNKLNKIEQEEKRKAELLFKEEKEQKRLQEREKLMQEKIETAKKKREEKMKKIVELKTQQQEDVLKRKEELEAKQREAEENKKRFLEEKRKEEFEKQRIKEQQRVLTTISVAHSNNNLNIMTSAQKVKPFTKTNFTPLHSTSKSNASNENKIANEIANKPKIQPKALNYDVCKTPSTSTQKSSKVQNLKGTPIVKKKTYENYDICDLKSGDDTDDDEEPSKPIPEWAKGEQLTKKAIVQCCKEINYTKLFKASSQNEIILENIFKIKRKKFTERSSSAIWNSPPVWRTNGLNGDESFRQLHHQV